MRVMFYQGGMATGPESKPFVIGILLKDVGGQSLFTTCQLGTVVREVSRSHVARRHSPGFALVFLNRDTPGPRLLVPIRS